MGECQDERSTGGWTTVEQTEVVIPNFTIKELLDAIPYVDQLLRHAYLISVDGQAPLLQEIDTIVISLCVRVYPSPRRPAHILILL